MTRLRFACAAFVAWLVLFFNIERIYSPINIASSAYILTAACALVVLLWPAVNKVRPAVLLLLAFLVFLGMKYALGYLSDGSGLPIILTECCALAVTIFLARCVAINCEDLHSAVFCNLSTDLKKRAQPFGIGQDELYREVRRARLFERPLAFLAIGPAAGTVEAAKDRLTEEVMQRILHQYVTARVGDLLSRRLKDCDVIAQRNCHFIAALPETNREAARAISRRLQTESLEKLGIELNVGLCTFPEDEGTFVGLLERAEQEMNCANGRSSTDDELPDSEEERFDPSESVGTPLLVNQATV